MNFLLLVCIMKLCVDILSHKLTFFFFLFSLQNMESLFLISLTQQGMDYYHNYDRLSLSIHIALGFMGWIFLMICHLLRVSDAYNYVFFITTHRFLICQMETFSLSAKICMRDKINPVIVKKWYWETTKVSSFCKWKGILCCKK